MTLQPRLTLREKKPLLYSYSRIGKRKVLSPPPLTKRLSREFSNSPLILEELVSNSSIFRSVIIPPTKKIKRAFL